MESAAAHNTIEGRIAAELLEPAPVVRVDVHAGVQREALEEAVRRFGRGAFPVGGRDQRDAASSAASASPLTSGASTTCLSAWAAALPGPAWRHGSLRAAAGRSRALLPSSSSRTTRRKMLLREDPLEGVGEGLEHDHGTGAGVDDLMLELSAGRQRVGRRRSPARALEQAAGGLVDVKAPRRKQPYVRPAAHVAHRPRSTGARARARGGGRQRPGRPGRRR